MSKRIVLFLTVVFFFPVPFAVAESFQDDLIRYVDEVTVMLEEQTDDEIIHYLNNSLILVNSMRDNASRKLVDTHALESLGEAYFLLPEELSLAAIQSQAIQTESELYRRYIQPYIKQNYLIFLSAQQNILQRKYFSLNDHNANFVEGYLNSKLPLTRINLNDTLAKQDPYLGVSPWEATFRVEPAMVFVNQLAPALLLTLGATFTVLPEVNLSVSPPDFQETFATRFIQKAGPRIGFGAMQKEGEVQWVMGAGMHLRSVAIWALYDYSDQKVALGVGLSDISVLAKVIGWY
ncbi:hypothetical protein [Reinekea sp. G2M2-21]|uniref:hypothetical protein n=1 Tax=Reinekea sp. G2M2-21 TaxID=2788942 RepID=UPI0018AB0D27|nr:hypothetical protein [Reinekea sp. G2M2-21]